MADNDFSSAEFEEGEVDDNSESDVEASPLEHKDEKRRPDARRHPRHEKHQAKHKYDKKPDRKSRHKPTLPAKSNGHSLHESSAEKEPRSRHVPRRPTLKDYLSEDEVDFRVSERERMMTGRHHLEDRRKRKRRRMERVPSRTPQTQCRYFMEGRCHKGESCPYAHDFVPPKKQELCKFYAVGVCSKGPSCLYLHGEFPCKFYHLSGNCNHGDSCKFSHSPLTPATRSLLDRAVPSKDGSLAENERGSGTGYPGGGDHGDIDYRFGASNPPLHPRDNFDGPPGQRNLFAPNFPPEERNHGPPCSNFEPHERPDPYPSLLRPPINEGPVRPFGSDPHLIYRPPNPFGPALLPLRYPGPGNMPDGGFVPPPPLHPMHNPNIRSPPDMRPRPPVPHPHRPPMYDMPEWNPEFAHFRPPLGHPPGPAPPFPVMFPPGGAPAEEAIVSSELDKMAALLAASKPPPNRNVTSTADPRIAPTPSPDVRSESATVRSDDLPTTPIQNSTPSDERLQRRTSLSFSSPELNVVPPKPATSATATPVPWRLIPLDMNVKIPYPLMQLPIDDLPHRFEDPRLRGQLTAFRAHLKPTVQLEEIGKPNPKATEDDPQPDIPDPVQQPAESTQEKTEPTQRRPFKLQLNEMASTFSANTFTPISANRSGDRSYLDDPRFRRRRIVTCVSTPATTHDTVITSVSETSLDSENKLPA